MADENLVEYLKRPEAYPEGTGSVHLIETHISWVFVCDEYAYKLKKPLDLGFLDFTSLEKRERYTREELRLNSRFSPGIYLDVVPVSRAGGGYILGDGTDVVEYALKMRRIPEDVMLSVLLKRHLLSDRDMVLVGERLAEAYARIGSSEKVRTFGSVPVIRFNVEENFAQTRRYIGGPVDARTFRAIEAWSLSFIGDNRDVFEERIESGHIRDCHGDLHLEHVCLQEGHVFAFDCIEFNERFRYGDVASDVAFLSMDLDYNGRSDLAHSFEEAFMEASQDATMPEVLPFYKVYRAYVRAKVTSFMLDRKGLEDEERETILKKAGKYYNLAYRYTIA